MCCRLGCWLDAARSLQLRAQRYKSPQSTVHSSSSNSRLETWSCTIHAAKVAHRVMLHIAQRLQTKQSTDIHWPEPLGFLFCTQVLHWLLNQLVCDYVSRFKFQFCFTSKALQWQWQFSRWNFRGALMAILFEFGPIFFGTVLGAQLARA